MFSCLYREALLKQNADLVDRFLRSDNLKGMRIWDKNQESQYEKIRFIKRALKKQGSSYPKELPFSESIFKVHLTHKDFINSCENYIKDIELSSDVADNNILDAAEGFNKRCILGVWSKIFETNEFRNRIVKDFSLLVQFIINCRELEKSSKDFFRNIEEKLQRPDDKKKQERLKNIKGQISNLGSDLRGKAEVFIGEQINTKIDTFFKDSQFDWTLPEASGKSSNYLVELINYLRNIFNLLSGLPDASVATVGCQTACQHSVFNMLELLMKVDSVDYITMGAINQFNMDLIHAESFLSSEIVDRLLKPGGHRGGAVEMPIIKAILEEIHQTIDLFLEWDWQSYIAEYGKPTARYHRVNPLTAVNVLEKLTDDKSKNTNAAAGGSSVFASLSLNKKDKKSRQKDAVVRQLKDLVGNWSRMHQPTDVANTSSGSTNESFGSGY